MAIKRTYFGALDGIRGVAAVIVAMRHTGYMFGITLPESFLAVDVFFVLSGVVIASSYEARLLEGLTLRDFLRIRLIRLYPLYIAGTLISVGALVATHAMGYRHLALLMALAAAFVPIPIGGGMHPFPLDPPGWSLFFELTVNVAYAGFIRFLKTRALLVVAAISAVLLAVGVALLNTVDHSVNVGWSRHTLALGFPRAALSFAVGVVLYRKYIADKPSKLARPNLAAWAIVGLTGLVLLGSPHARLQQIYDFAAILFVFPALVWTACRLEISGSTARIFKFFGLASYAIYAVHVPLDNAIEQIGWGGQYYVLSRYAPWIGPVFIVGVIGLAWILDKYYDGPVRKSLTQLFARPQLSRRGEKT
ncbi:MAG: acyltransferase family protein [Fimbriimonadaceae bacterium]